MGFIDKKKILNKNLEEIFQSQVSNALNSFPEINFLKSEKLKDLLHSENCFVLAFKNHKKVSDLNAFTKDEANYIDEFLSSEKFDECDCGEIKSLKAKINGKFSYIFCLQLDSNNKDSEKKDCIESKEAVFVEGCFKKIAIKIKKLQIENVNIIFNSMDHLISPSLHGFVFNNFYFTLKNIENLKTKLSSIKVLNYFDQNFSDSYKYIYNNLELKALSESINLTKAYSNAPANIINPETWSEMIKKDLSGIENVNVKILSVKEMLELGMNSLVGVGLGSKSESKLVIIEYNGSSKKDDEKISFVGKGITFDTGGLSLKPGDYMEGMKYDKSGAASVFGAVRALAKRGAKVNVVVAMALAENAVSENAQRPDDVVVSMSGQTIDIRNTDAEGRLVLADALTYVQKFYKPKLIVDLATLTGAMSVALGSNIYAGLFSNNDDLSANLIASGLTSNEKLWRMPLESEYNKKMDSKVADMQNTSNTRGFGAGSSTAAAFLERFIESETQWAHLDIANVDNLSSDSECHFYGSCAFGVRLLNELAKLYESKN